MLTNPQLLSSISTAAGLPRTLGASDPKKYPENNALPPPVGLAVCLSVPPIALLKLSQPLPVLPPVPPKANPPAAPETPPPE